MPAKKNAASNKGPSFESRLLGCLRKWREDPNAVFVEIEPSRKKSAGYLNGTSANVSLMAQTTWVAGGPTELSILK
jgi:hypothetical protein